MESALLPFFWFFLVRRYVRRRDRWHRHRRLLWFYDRNFYFRSVIIKVWNSRRLWKCIDWHAATVARGDTGDKGKRRWEVAFAFPPTRGNHDSTNESHRIGMSSIRGNRRITDELCGFFGHKSTGTMQRKRVVIYFTRVTVFLYGTVDNHAFAICNSRES